MRKVTKKFQQHFNSTFRRDPGEANINASSARVTLPRKNIIITAHGARMPVVETLNSAPRWDTPIGTRKSQWFKVKNTTSVYFPVEATSGIAGGCSIFGTTGLESARKICSSYSKYTGKQSTADQIQMRFENLQLNEKRPNNKVKIPLRSGDWLNPDLHAFVTADPSSSPLFEKRHCIPNMILVSDESINQKAMDYGVYECMGGGDMQEIRLIKKSSLEEEVKYLEYIYPNYDLHIYVYACMVAVDTDKLGNPLPFLRPAQASEQFQTNKYGIFGLTPAERDCDTWAANELGSARIKDNNQKLYRQWLQHSSQPTFSSSQPDELSNEFDTDTESINPSDPGGYLFPENVEDLDREYLSPAEVDAMYRPTRRTGGRRRRTRKFGRKRRKARRRRSTRKRK